MRIGIFFGGQSREREISFAGGRTVYDNLNKALFEPVPIFVDSIGNFIHLDWEYIYKGTIRDFYPPSEFLPDSPNYFQLYMESLGKLDDTELNELISKVGRHISPEKFSSMMDFAFLALHGPFGEDGNIQGLLEWYNIPFSGSGILPSAIGIDKVVQRHLLNAYQFAGPKSQVISREDWLNHKNRKSLFDSLVESLGLPLVVKAPHQGSSIGVSIVSEADYNSFENAVNKSLFIKEISKNDWFSKSEEEKKAFLINLIDIREGIGMPVHTTKEIIYHPDHLLGYLNTASSYENGSLSLTPFHTEESILFESYIKGQEFSCIVIQNEEGDPVALPPTEIIKGKEVFDYRSKYLPGMSRKITPINASAEIIDNIRKECSRLFQTLHCNVYARIDGFVTPEGKVFLNDPNTTSGMLPSSFFFHQAAEIGLNPSQFLTYIIRTSLAERIKTGKRNLHLRTQLQTLDNAIKNLQEVGSKKISVGVIMGGFSSERHISVESGRNIYEKLSSSTKYSPVPIFLTGTEAEHKLYVLPINVMLKDNADDIKEKILHYQEQSQHPVIRQIKEETASITQKYVDRIIQDFKPVNYADLNDLVDVVFIALHGRPGEDGAVQNELEKYQIPYNGSGIASSQLTINKYDTNEVLAQNGIKVAQHRLIYESEWQENQQAVLDEIEKTFNYPIIGKPADDGCSSAVKKLKSREELIAFAQTMFRKTEAFEPGPAAILKLKPKEEFPQKTFFLIEELISKGDAKYFLEITGGLLTKAGETQEIEYEVFEPSEALASGEVLSLEEKFLAGEGQNITPARYHKEPAINKAVSLKVREELGKVARILNVEGYARIDAFVRIYENHEVETIIIEVNSLPGMTPATCIFHQSAINGYKPYDFIDAILQFGMQRRDRSSLSV